MRVPRTLQRISKESLKLLLRDDLISNFPALIFHELHHSSAMYKLLESSSDVKLVQSDMGNASATISLDTYVCTPDTRHQALTEKITSISACIDYATTAMLANPLVPKFAKVCRS